MKGLKQYIAKHGKHFTERLALDVIASERWDTRQIEKDVDKRVWFNVTSSTFGDIIYLVNAAYAEYPPSGHNTKNRCIDYALFTVGNVNSEGLAFAGWLADLVISDKDFDFRKYI